jgi:hypothetical protein
LFGNKKETFLFEGLLSVDQKYEPWKKKSEERFLSAFETLCWRRMLNVEWTDRVTNDAVFQRAKE